jgi:tRNA nucleotidyltransferase/poly(A) polymerase
MKIGLIRTPLPPLTTFLDDPLRVLRAIRFSSRLGFPLHPDLCAAAMEKEVQLALQKKISKERIGQELKGMFNTSPLNAFKLIYELHLYDIVFELPPSIVLSEEERQQYRFQSIERMGRMTRYLKDQNILGTLEKEDKQVSKEKSTERKCLNQQYSPSDCFLRYFLLTSSTTRMKSK